MERRLALCACIALAIFTALVAGMAKERHPVEVLPIPHRPADLVKSHVLPDPTLTPGAIFADVGLRDIRRPNYSAGVRNVPDSEKREVFRRYGIDYADHSEYEVDHAVELAAGGANAVENLWPEKLHIDYHGRDMGAIEKDKMEKKVLAGIRDGSLPLRETQIELARDWTMLYRKLVAPEFPSFHRTSQ